VHIHDVVVRYADGSAEVVPVDLLVGLHTQTEPIALSEPWKGVSSIELSFGEVYGRRPYVTAYGLW